VAGQSAGALSAWLMLAAPSAAGLFRGAILQSPPLADGWQRLDAAERWAAALGRLAGSDRFDAGALRSLPAERLVELHEALLAEPPFRGTRGGALPTLEPATLPRSPAEDPGASPEVPVLIGTTADEGTFFFASPWSSDSAPERVTALATDAMFARPVAAWSGERARTRSAPVYRYRVDHPGAGAELGATHCVDVPLLFGTYQDGGPGERLAGAAPGASEVAAALGSAWGRFIHGEGPGWRALDPAAGASELAVFGGEAPLRIDSAGAV
jgi:para-nitrobenzyl esterase